MEKLPNDYTLWKVLRHFETHTCKGKGVNLTARGVPQMDAGGSSGQLYYETPMLQIEKRSFTTFVDFQKTMSQLGYNGGSVLIRLTFQKTDKTLVDAMSDISQYFQEDGTRTEGKQAADATAKVESAPVVQESDAPAAAQEESTSLDTSTTQPPGTSEPDLMDIDAPPTDALVPVHIFSAPSNSTPAAAQTTESDETYQVGIVHAQQHQHRLKTAGQNKRLLSDKELEEKAAAEEARLNAIKAIDIKVRFPDNTSAAWRMGPDAAGETLYAAVRRVMADDKLKFKLIVPGIKDKITDDGSKLIKDHGLGGSTLVTLFWDESVPTESRAKPFLKGSVASRATEIVVPQAPEIEVEEEEPGPSVRKPAEKPKHEGDVNKKLSKWLKLGKK
jgi:tether containing UBX domain for GLUT4